MNTTIKLILNIIGQILLAIVCIFAAILSWATIDKLYISIAFISALGLWYLRKKLIKLGEYIEYE